MFCDVIKRLEDLRFHRPPSGSIYSYGQIALNKKKFSRDGNRTKLIYIWSLHQLIYSNHTFYIHPLLEGCKGGLHIYTVIITTVVTSEVEINTVQLKKLLQVGQFNSYERTKFGRNRIRLTDGDWNAVVRPYGFTKPIMT